GRVDPDSIKVLAQILKDAGLVSATISSGKRTADDQARIMFGNFQKKDGVSAGRSLYGSSGNKVIDAYETAIKSGLDPKQDGEKIISQMEQKIKDLKWSPGHMSGVAFDVDPSSLGSKDDKNRFEQAAKEHERVNEDRL